MEIWDGYFENGELAGVDLIRGKEIPRGIFHMVCEVLVRHKDGSYLLMQRDLEKETHPGEWEASAGGSALKGESKWQCVKRELFEETGISCDEFTEVAGEVYYRKGCRFYCFVCQVDCRKDAVKFQTGETIAYKWVTEEEFIDFVNSGQMIPGPARRYSGYFKTLNYIK